MKKIIVAIFLFAILTGIGFSQTRYPIIHDPTSVGEYVRIIDRYKAAGFYEMARVEAIVEHSYTFFKIIQDNPDFIIAVYQNGHNKTVVFYFRHNGRWENRPYGTPEDCLIHDSIRTIIRSSN